MQPGDLGVVMRRAKDDVGQQQKLERQDIGDGERAQHQSEMDEIGSAHRELRAEATGVAGQYQRSAAVA
jgi:hypothetical protein